jgi:hypothetical protein
VTRAITILAGTAVIAAALSTQAFSQGAPATPPAPAHTPPTLTLPSVKIDLPLLATGYRTSRAVGSPVVNAANEAVGTLDDLIVTPDARVSFAVLSIGGFLGVNTRYVVVPYSALEVHDKQVLLRDGTKDTLKALPEFKYGT